MMNGKLILVALMGLLGLLAGAGIAQANPDSLDVCCAWDGSLADGDLTYTISGGDATAQGWVRDALEEWEPAVPGLTLTEITDGTKPNIQVRFQGGGGVIAGSAQRSFDGAGFVKSVRLKISGKAFGNPNNEATVKQVTRHEAGHALGLGHADFTGDLMTPIIGGTDLISACDVQGVLEANHWALVDDPVIGPHAPHTDPVDCGGVTVENDLAVTGVTATASAVVGDSVSVDVTVQNQGTANQQNFDVTLTDTTEAGLIATVNVTSILTGPSGSITVNFNWVTTALTPGDHILRAEVVLASDGDPADNTATATVTLISASAAIYHVESMTFAVKQRGPFLNLVVTMLMHDASDVIAPQGVDVIGTISRTVPGDRTFNRREATDANGEAVWKLGKALTDPTVYTVRVTGADDGAGSGFDDTIGQPCRTIKIFDNGTFTLGSC